MKVALITDLHFGVKRGSEIFLESQLKFFKEQFIPELLEKGIDTIFILGDFFDNRVHLDSKILNSVLDLFNNDLKDFKVHIIVGNHDSYHESTIEVNSVKVFELFQNAKVYEKNESILIGNTTIYMCPWITNNQTFLDELEVLENHDLCFGHFNFINFKMFKNQDADHGLDSSKFFEKFKLTISGHFHTRSSKKIGDSEILYMGNPFHLTRNDIGDDRGYSILDINTLEYEHINNTKSLKFITIKYPQTVSKEQIQGNHVDLFVDYDENYNELDVQAYVEKLDSFEPAFPIVLKINNKLDVDASDVIAIESMEELIKESFRNVDIEYKDEVESLILSLYAECKSDI